VSEFASIRRLDAADLPAYKRLRDEMLLAHPEAFSSDAASEKVREPAEYLQRLGLDRRDGGHFVVGAWHEGRLLGAAACERELRLKVRHLGHIVGMMVSADARGQGIGRDLLDAAIAGARVAGLEMLTLTVTAGNAAAIHLYETSGFVRYGSLPRALRIGNVYHDKLHMMLAL